MRPRLLILVGLILVPAPNVHAQVGDPTLRSDHPQYPGEGAFQTIEDCVAFATAGTTTPQEQAIALYYWLLTHQWHLKSPQEWCIPGRVPDTEQTRDYENVVYDANIGRFSYGYGLCGTVHAWNEPYWQALGMRARRRAFPGHVNSEIFYDGRWHAFDTDMAGLLFRKDGIVAGYDDIIADPTLADSVKPPHPHYPFAWPGDFQTMKKGWQQVAAGGHWYSMYNGGYAAQPGIIHLRKGETFTRYYDPDHYGGPSKRRFWHHMKDGPQRPWSFYGQDEPKHEGATHNARNDVRYSNGEFVYRPVAPDRSLHSTPWRISEYSHWSPYVIAGDPADDANPMTGAATGGLVVTGFADESVWVRAESDDGWQLPGNKWMPAKGRFTLDLTEQVKGRFGWTVTFRLASSRSQPSDLKFTTVTQVSPAMYPRLIPNGCDVTYRAASRAVVPNMSHFGPQEPGVESTEFRSRNVAYEARNEGDRFAYRTNDNRAGRVTFQVHAPQPLVEVCAAVRYQVRVPPPEDAHYQIDVSTDGGSTSHLLAVSEIPSDNEHSSGWLAGSIDVSPDKVKSALVEVQFYAGGHKTGLIDARLFGICKTPKPGPLTITYGWKEAGQPRQHTERVAAGTGETTFTVPTGENIEDDFVRLAAE